MRTPVFEPQGFCRNPKSDTSRSDWVELELSESVMESFQD